MRSTQAVDGVWWNPREGAEPVTAVCTGQPEACTPAACSCPGVGERFDGHDFIDAALDAGAAGCLCAKLPEHLRP